MSRRKFDLKGQLSDQKTKIESPKRLEEHNPYLIKFIEEREFDKIKESTIKEDVLRLRIFLSFCDDIGKIPETMDYHVFKRFFVYLEKKRGCTHQTLVRYYNLLKVFYRLFKFTAFNEFNNECIERKTFSKKSKTRSYDDVNNEIMDKVLDEILDGNSATKNRDGLMMLVLWETGCRRSEVIHIKYNDFDFKTGQIRLTDTKNGEDRYVVVSKKTTNLIREYSSENILKGPENFIFQSEKGKLGKQVKPGHLSEVFRRAIDNLISKGEIEAGKRYVLHSLRHGRAVALLDEGTSVEIVKEILGHSDVKTTMIYAHAKERTKKMLPDIRKKLDQR
jgi:integrase/recombinase XerD